MQIYTPPAAPDTIPLIDLHGASRDPAIRADIFRQVHRACREMGFFYVVNHGVPEDVRAGAFAASARVMSASDDSKQAIDAGNSRRGYEPPARQVLDPGSPADYKESFQFDTAGESTELPASERNRWPADLPDVKPALTGYLQHMQSLGHYLMECLAGSLELPPNYFDDGLANPSCSVRALRYPPLPQSADIKQLGAGAHTDWGAITLLMQDQVGGLEVQNEAGDWVSATPIEGSFVVNLGDMVCRWTNDLYRSTRHRVLNNRSARYRASIACFYGPEDTYAVRCVPTCRPEQGEPNYPPCTVGEHVREMIRLTYGEAA